MSFEVRHPRHRRLSRGVHSWEQACGAFLAGILGWGAGTPAFPEPVRNPAPDSRRHDTAGTEQASSLTPSQPAIRAPLTSVDLLRGLRNRTPDREVVLPESALEKSLREPSRKILPEGTPWAGRTGWIASDGDGWTFVPDPSDGDPPLRILPNAHLELMIQMARGSSSPIRFLVSGEVTAFVGDNYLFLRTALRSPDTPADAPIPDRPNSAPVPSVHTDAAPEDVLARLDAQLPDAVVLRPVESVGSPERFGSRIGPSNLFDGTPLIARPGRLVRQASWWTFIFESDQVERSAPTLRILPSQGLERMLQSTDGGRTAGVFVVSGEVTLFEGENYLLPRVTLRRLDGGNFRR